jgi:release factor glutamine methyltransferase
VEIMLLGDNVFDLTMTARRALENSGISNIEARSDSDLLLSAVLGIEKNKLALIRDKKLSLDEIKQFDEYINRRSNREPTYYIIGSCEFMGLEFNVNKNVLIPRQETEILVEKIIEISKGNQFNSFLDLCCGSGAIAVSVSKLAKIDVIIASDISCAALDIAKLNASLNNVDKIEFINSNLFENFGDRKFDIIAVNPPYIADKEKVTLAPELFFEPEIALFAKGDGMVFYREIARQAHKFLNSGGHILIEMNANFSAQIKQIFAQSGYKNIEIIKDYSRADRVLWIK